MTEHITNDQAFSMGSDARLAGQLMRSNPFTSPADAKPALYWRMGWRHVNHEWGAQNPRARRLKPIADASLSQP